MGNANLKTVINRHARAYTIITAGLLLFYFVVLLFAVSAYAQAPTSTSNSTSTLGVGGPTQTCDLCGKCGDDVPQDWADCKACIEKKDYTWTVLGCLPTSPGGFVQSVLRVTTSIVGGIAFLALLYGGGMVLVSSGSPERLEAGKSIIKGAIIGLLLVVFSVFILQFIGVTVFELPGFG